MSEEQKRRWSLFPKTLSACIEPVTKPVLKTQGLAGSRIISEWPAIVGAQLSSHCQPQKLSFPAGKKTDGTLSIAVENGFAPELQHMQPLILERLATYFGYKAVSRITIAHTYAPQTQKPPEPMPKPLSKASISLTENIEDEELRAALSNMAKTLSTTT